MPFGQPDGFAQTIENGNLPMPQLADDHVKTVGAEVNGRDYFSGYLRP